MSEHKKFFIIQMGRMGDIVQTLPLIRRLRDENSPCEITLLCIREPAALIRDLAAVDRFVSIPFAYYKKLRSREDTSSGLSFLLDVSELRESYDLVINLTHDFFSASLCSSIRSRKKSGLVRGLAGVPRMEGDWGKYLFSVASNSINRAENLVNLVDIHIGMGGQTHKAMDKWLNTAEAARTDEILIENGWKRRGRLIAFQMGANQLHRAWPVGGFVEVWEALAQHPDLEAVLLGGPRETGLGEEFLRRANRPAINLIGKTDLADLPSILSKCDLLVGNDTGTAHIAAAVGIRVLGLYFSTAFFGETAPFGGGHVVLQVETQCTPCLKDRCPETWCRDFLAVEAVQAAAQMMLWGRKEAPPLRAFDNLSIYESRFLSNGTLIYAPVSPTVSQRYQGAFLNRIVWESALGLEHDEEFIGEFWEKLKPLETFRSKIEASRREYALLGAHYQDSLRTLHQAALTGPNGSAAGIDIGPPAAGDSLMQAFHRFEMMGMEGKKPLETYRELVEKYAKLYSLVNSTLGLLETMAAGKIP